MVDCLQASHPLHEVGAKTAEMSPWEKIFTPITAEGSQDFIVQFDNRTSDCAAMARSEDRKQLGMLLRTPRAVSAPERAGHHSSPKPGARKRSLSRMLESEFLDESRLVRSNTSSGSRDRPTADDDESCRFSPASAGSAPRNNPLKFRNPARLVASGIDKDLLTLSLPAPNSSLGLELSSGSSIDRNPSDGLQKFDASYGSCRCSGRCSTDGSSQKDNGGGTDMHYSTIDAWNGRGFLDDARGDTSTLSSNETSSPAVAIDELEDRADQVFLRLDSAKFRPSGEDKRRRNSKCQPLTECGEVVPNRQDSLGQRDMDTGPETHGLQLVHLLLKCADAAAKQNVQLAARILGELYQGVSLYGDAMQRVAAYFAEGLAARIISKESRLYSALMVHTLHEVDFFSAFTTLYKVAPYFQFAHFTANQAILEAFEGHSTVHVVDLDIMQGFQWPSLIQALALRPGGPPRLRITGIGKRAKTVRETGRRLSSFAAGFDIPFEFQAVVEERLENLTPDALAPRAGEAIAVNAVLQMHRLLNSQSGENLHKFMHALCRKLNPCLVTLVEQEANHNAPSFRGRFMEALHYYAAVFDSLDASLPQQSDDRVKVEKLFFAPQIKNIVVCDGDDRFERHETLDLWQKRMGKAGFVQVPLSTHAISQANLLLQFCPCKGYRLRERSGSISLGWQERELLTVSAWSC